MDLRDNRRLSKILLSISSLVFTIGVLKATHSPPQGYELSIYSATPRIFWIGCALIILSSLIVVFVLTEYEAIGEILSISATLAIIGLPVVRGYFFVSEADAMTHLGAIKDLKNTVTAGEEIFYPLSYILTLSISGITRYSIEYSMQVVLLVFVGIFILGTIGLFNQVMSNNINRHIGIFSALLLLPVGRNGVHFAPNTLARMYLPFLLLLLLMHISTRKPIRYVVLSHIFSLGLLFIHPQIFLLYLVISISFSLLMYLDLTSILSGLYLNKNTVLALVLSNGVLLVFWILRFDTFQNAFQSFVLGLINPSPGAETASGVSSLLLAGGSPIIVLLKIFFTEITYIVISTAVILLTIKYLYYNVLSSKPVHSSALVSLCFWILPIFILFAITLAVSQNYTRYFTASMPIVTVLGGVGLSIFIVNREKYRSYFSIIFIILILLSVTTFFPSPYIYQANTQVPESQFSGYESAFNYADQDTNFVRVRSPVFRYIDALRGERTSNFRQFTGDRWRATVPYHFADQSLSSHYDNKTYLAVTATDRKRDPVAYNGIRYSSDDFNYLEESNNINKVLTNNGFDLYYVR
ncbi:hypothetical protein [Halorubrum kocurii]|uniref:hypothetical protein n=1 Tax=Halorubrum kocurii TaxID=478441 RepID=UPI000AA9AF05|nr:hypothetical protein [Halorubrum kocurii]